MSVITTFRHRYLHVQRLRMKLENIFGAGNFSMKIVDDAIEVAAPRRLTGKEYHKIFQDFEDFNLYRCNDEDTSDTSSTRLSSPRLNEADDAFAVVDTVPLYDLDGVPIPGKDANEPCFVKFRFDVTTHRAGAHQYLEHVDDGETATVYSVRAEIMSSRNPPGQFLRSGGKPVIKIAIKRLKASTPFSLFKAELLALRRTESINHPNIVSYLGSFKKVESEVQLFHFMFPQALGNLKRLFRGEYGRDAIIQGSRDSLWSQYAGLASAVAYLHVSLNIAHRDIKPSNILIHSSKFPNSSNDELVLKIADFGLSVDLTKIPSIRSTHEVRIPSRKEVLSGDIWQLGCVFTEMTAYLTGDGSKGVSDFRNRITTTEDNVESNRFNDTRFDDGEKVKPEVLQWIEETSNLDRKARRIAPLLRKMLAKSSDRPTAEEVVSSSLDIHLARLSYSDGIRTMSLVESRNIKPLPRFDRARLAIEGWIGQPIDWSPFPKVWRASAPDEVIASWQVDGKELTVALSESEVESLGAVCVPLLSDNATPGLPPPAAQRSNTEEQPNPTAPTGPYHGGEADNNAPCEGPLLPQFYTSPRTNQHSPGIRTYLSSWLPGWKRAESSRPQGTEPESYWGIFCCFNRMYTDPLETVLQIIIRDNLRDDEEFCEYFHKHMRDAAGPWLSGWFRRLLSWKTCTKIEFVKFKRMDGGQVSFLQSSSLPPNEENSWKHGFHDPKNNMKIFGEEMATKLRNPKLARGQRKIISKLPTKKFPEAPDDSLDWGIYASMDISAKKVGLWFIVGELVSVGFCIVWVWYKGDTQLTAAVIPGTVFMSFLALLNGIIQSFEKSRDPLSGVAPSETPQPVEGASSAVESGPETQRRRLAASRVQTR